MSLDKLVSRNVPLQTPYGTVTGTSFRWPSGQYCALHTDRGFIGCGIYDVHIAGEFGIAVAIAKGTPAQPLCEPEDLYEAVIVEVSEPARRLGIQPGMKGLEAVGKLLVSSQAAMR